MTHFLVSSARVKDLSEQADHSLRNLRRLPCPLDQYVYLVDLLDRNERLFYKLLADNVMELMPIVYTPTVGLACQKYGFVFERPKGLSFKNPPNYIFTEILSNGIPLCSFTVNTPKKANLRLGSPRSLKGSDLLQTTWDFRPFQGDYQEVP